MTIWVGTSGWQYTSWKKRFYPEKLPQRRWLEYFSQQFPTVEVNNSFYMLPKETAFERWRDESADGFLVTVKANRYITHIKRLTDPKDPVKLFWSRAKKLGPKLGPVLFQFPPNFRADLGRLKAFVKVLPKAMRPAFEFRDASWESDEVYEVLDRAGAAYVLADRPGWKIGAVVTGGWSYVRFHEGRRTSPFYPRAKLRRWADAIAELPARDTYVYFNNDPLGAAIKDARTMMELLETRGLDVVRLEAEQRTA
ncbi:MAG: DUF72 domain-containing protein [Actinomycetota bacterium]